MKKTESSGLFYFCFLFHDTIIKTEERMNVMEKELQTFLKMLEEDKDVKKGKKLYQPTEKKLESLQNKKGEYAELIASLSPFKKQQPTWTKISFYRTMIRHITGVSTGNLKIITPEGKEKIIQKIEENLFHTMLENKEKYSFGLTGNYIFESAYKKERLKNLFKEKQVKRVIISKDVEEKVSKEISYYISKILNEVWIDDYEGEELLRFEDWIRYEYLITVSNLKKLIPKLGYGFLGMGNETMFWFIEKTIHSQEIKQSEKEMYQCFNQHFIYEKCKKGISFAYIAHYEKIKELVTKKESELIYSTLTELFQKQIEGYSSMSATEKQQWYDYFTKKTIQNEK